MELCFVKVALNATLTHRLHSSHTPPCHHQVGFPDLAKAKGALTSVFKIVDRVSPIDPASTEGLTLDSRAVRGEVELQNVVFAYPARPSVKVFNNFCLHIPAGV